MNVDFEKAREYERSPAYQESYEVRRERQQREANQKYTEWCKRMEQDSK